MTLQEAEAELRNARENHKDAMYKYETCEKAAEALGKDNEILTPITEKMETIKKKLDGIIGLAEASKQNFIDGACFCGEDTTCSEYFEKLRKDTDSAK